MSNPPAGPRPRRAAGETWGGEPQPRQTPGPRPFPADHHNIPQPGRQDQRYGDRGTPATQPASYRDAPARPTSPTQPAFPPRPVGAARYDLSPQWNDDPARDPGPNPSHPGLSQEPTNRGVIALALAVAAAVLGLVLAYLGAAKTGELMRTVGYQPGTSQLNKPTPAHKELYNAAAWLYIAQLLPSLAGIAAVVLGVLARRFAKARLTGTVAIIVAVLAPIVALILFFGVLSPLVPHA